jgi:branched-chain amino acid transport system permease protein
MSSRRDWQVLLILALIGLALPMLASDFGLSLAMICLMYAALSSSWALFCGSTRYLSLATSAFFGVGAYTSALLLGDWPWLAVIAAGAAVAALLALIMGAAVLHLRGTYFAMLTFGMTELIMHAVTFVEKSLSGTVGRVLITVPDNLTVYLTVLALALLAVAVSIVIRKSRFGLALAGIGADEQRAQTLGVDTRLVKIGGFALTAAFAGAVGAAMAVRWTYIDPHSVFNSFIGFQTVLIALIGGATTLWGPLIAAIVFSLLSETLRLQVPQLYMMALGLLLIICVLYLPDGLASLRWPKLVTLGWAMRKRSGRRGRDDAGDLR